MENAVDKHLAPVLFLPHGGGPLPLLGDPGHQKMVDFLKHITPSLGNPEAIVVISAHWEESQATITAGENPELIYDYFGFPDEAYAVQYPVTGDPKLAQRIFQLLQENGIDAKLDVNRGFDHGVFVPLKIMYPQANIPCVQLSLVNSLNAELHIKVGQALSALRRQNILILGSGFSFHNLRVMLGSSEASEGNQAFERWLSETCCSQEIDESQRLLRLAQWDKAPYARYCHPREEHLLPLHVCYGIAKTPARMVFNDTILHTLTSAYLW